MKSKKASNKKEAKKSAVSFTDNGWEDYMHWQKEDQLLAEKVNKLIEACLVDPFKGIGKPEPLKGNLTGFWSRRIDREHRLVYSMQADTLHIVACRFHY